MRKIVSFTMISILCFIFSGCEMKETDEHKDYGYKADLTHDGNEETITLNIDSTDSSTFPVIKISVSKEDAVIYEQEVFLQYAKGEQYYLVTYEGADYLMRYKPLVDHDYAVCEYEVFSFDEQNQKDVLDYESIEISLFDIDKLDKDAWIGFAEKENQYFKEAFLIVSTSEAELKYSDPKQKQYYSEEYLWLIKGEKTYDSLEQVLDEFIDQTKESYLE